MEGIRFRPPSPDDNAGLLACIHACYPVDDVDPYSTLESWASEDDIRAIINNTAPDDMRIAELDGVIAGYNRVMWWVEPGDVWFYLHVGRVHPTYRRQGIGTALLEWSEDRIRTLVKQHNPPQALMGANASSSEVDATQLLIDHGYGAVFTLAQMEFRAFETLNSPLIPDGFTIRAPIPEEAPLLWRTLRAAWDEKPAFGMPAPDEASDIAEMQDNIARNGHLWRVAWVGDAVTAQVWCSLNTYDTLSVGIFDEVDTHPAYRRRGLASTLIKLMLCEFHAMGVSSARLHTDADNSRGALSLYESVGFRTIKTFPRYRKRIEGVQVSV